MAAPKKFDEETRERAVRMYHDRLAAAVVPNPPRGHVGTLCDINQAAPQNWVERDTQIVTSRGTATVGEHDAALTALREEYAELRRTNDISKTG